MISGLDLFTYRGGVQYYDENSSFLIDLSISLIASLIGAFIGYILAIKTQRNIEKQKKRDEDYANACTLDFFISMLQETQEYCRVQITYWEEYIQSMKSNLYDISLRPKFSSNRILSRTVNYKLGDIMIPARKRYGGTLPEFGELYLSLDQMQDVFDLSYKQMITNTTNNHDTFKVIRNIYREIGSDLLKLKILYDYTDIDELIKNISSPETEENIVSNYNKAFVELKHFSICKIEKEENSTAINILATILTKSTKALDLISEITSNNELTIKRIEGNIEKGDIIQKQIIDSISKIVNATHF